MTEHKTSNPNYCEVCGKPATQWALRDLFGKSDEKRPLCGEHGFRLRDPADVAEIERLTAELAEATRLLELVRGKRAQADVDAANLQIERDRLRAALQKITELMLNAYCYGQIDCGCASCTAQRIARRALRGADTSGESHG